jgi:asparagine synthase (glutamine-hydrolysing)
MCGINGILSGSKGLKGKISLMNRILRHRGPDDEGITGINTSSGNSASFSSEDTIEPIKQKLPRFNDSSTENFDLFFGHRRLSIIDLSENGHGPMSGADGKIWITFNGEIYNYIELRKELRGHGFSFKTETDTEVIINAYLKWGVDCLNKFNGMWAFALWDDIKKQLFIARDRFGVKPLYYSKTKDYFAFSSEMKALIALNPDDFKINDERIPFYLLYGNRLNDEQTYLKNIHCLKAAHYLLLKENNLTYKKYYDIDNISLSGYSEDELSARLVELLQDSIKLRFRSDVPVGTCLSGGFDSSSIVSFSTKIQKSALNTFSAVWKDKNCDESKYIDIVNSAYGCTENKIEPKAEEFEKVFNELNYYQEIPTEGPGLYPQWYVMKKAAEKVTVLLDGQGGDEVFGGYFMMAVYLRAIIKDRNYKNLIKDFGHFFRFFNKAGIHSFSSWIFPVFYNKVVRGFLSEKFNILNKDLMSRVNRHNLYYDADPPKKFKSYINNLSYHFITNLTIPALLHYEDRSSMAHSIESRVPFLDYRLVEFGVNLPKKHLAYKDTSRPLYRKALSEYLPSEIVNRKDKLGYPTPFTVWSRTILKNYITDILGSNSAELYNYVDKNYLNKILKEHYSAKKKDYSWDIWRFLSFSLFLKLHKNEKLE